MRALLSCLTVIALTGVAGCHRDDDFKTGSILYSKADHSVAGKIVGFEARHDFGQGVVQQGAEVQAKDGKTQWVRVDKLGDLYTDH